MSDAAKVTCHDSSWRKVSDCKFTLVIICSLGLPETHTAHPSRPGATKIVGVDISSSMIEAASSHPDKSHTEYYINGDATNLKETILKTTNKTNLMPGAQFDIGCFDLSVAVFVFNYLTITAMDRCFKDVFSLLKPGGHFVFSVPHPFMSNHDGESGLLPHIQALIH